VRLYHEPLRGDVLHAALAHADAVVLMRDRTPLAASLIARLPRLKLVLFTGGRNAALDAAALAARASRCATPSGVRRRTPPAS